MWVVLNVQDGTALEIENRLLLSSTTHHLFGFLPMYKTYEEAVDNFPNNLIQFLDFGNQEK